MKATRTLQGVALFLFIPLVLFLFLRQPLGPGWSIACGLVLMFGHRLLALPWARRHAPVRCGWCGRTGDQAVMLPIASGGTNWRVAACRLEHANHASRFLTFVRRWRAPIAAGIFVPLFVLLAAGLADTVHRGFLPHGTATLQFRVIVAVTVVMVSVAYRAVRVPDAALVSVFPLHNLLLLGIRNTLWVFRIVGAWWLVDGARRLL